MFRVLDVNGDGMLSRKELEDAFAQHGSGVDNGEMDRLMDMIDLGGEDQLSLSEWVAATVSKDVLLAPEMLRRTF